MSNPLFSAIIEEDDDTFTFEVSPEALARGTVNVNVWELIQIADEVICALESYKRQGKSS